MLDKGVSAEAGPHNHTQTPMSYRYGDIVVPFVASDEPLVVEDRHLVDCLLTGTAPLTDGANGLAVVETLEAAELSRRLRRPVLLEELGSYSRFVSSVASGNGHITGLRHPRVGHWCGGPHLRRS